MNSTLEMLSWACTPNLYVALGTDLGHGLSMDVSVDDMSGYSKYVLAYYFGCMNLALLETGEKGTN